MKKTEKILMKKLKRYLRKQRSKYKEKFLKNQKLPQRFRVFQFLFIRIANHINMPPRPLTSCF